MGSGTSEEIKKVYQEIQKNFVKKAESGLGSNKSPSTNKETTPKAFKYDLGKVEQKLGIDVKSEEPLKILFAHDNGKEYYTVMAHKLADLVGQHPKIEKIVDYNIWGKGERTNPAEINNREKKMVQEADLIVRLIPPATKAGGRNEGAIREINKGINANKPILEIYMSGARDSPNRGLREKNYNKKVEVHLKEKQVLLNGFREGLNEVSKKGFLEKKIDLK
jgi:hypothetical protein